ncbi:MAG: hypothetical protein R3C05_21360 [Pirellulaceae bacterium]
MVELAGTLDLEGGDWNLDASTGSWHLRGGTIKNGTINQSDGSLLFATSTTSTLQDIVLNGDLDATQMNNARVSIFDGLELTARYALATRRGTLTGVFTSLSLIVPLDH